MLLCSQAPQNNFTKKIKMKKISLCLIVIGLHIFSACNKDMLRGGGSIGTRNLTVESFSSVETHYDISADISYGSTQEISVTGYDNLLDNLDFRVDNGILKLKYNTNYNTIRNGNVHVKIKTPVINNATIHGSKNIIISGFINGNNLNAKIHGSGNIIFTNGTLQKAVLDVHGSGNIDAQRLQAKQAETNVHGSGNISVTANEILKANIYGSGNIYYWGNPAVETVRNGSGRVIKRS